MTRIDADIQNCVIYLYHSVEDAWAGKRAGGSGFMLAVDSTIKPELRFLYAITNSRVIKSGFPVIRADSLSREIPPLEKSPKDWVHHPEGEDVAACLLGLASDHPQVSYYRVGRFLTRELLGQLGIGIGSDVFLMGRYITMRDVQCPSPVARYGKLAMMDRQFVRQPDGQSRECFLVTAFKPGEHSGAPVFVSPDQLLDRELSPGNERIATPWLLGIDQGCLQDYRPVVNAQGDRHPRGWKVSSPYGLIAVTPAWNLRELLGAEQLSGARRELELQAGGIKGRGPCDTRGRQEFTRADYLEALRLASHKLGTDIPSTKEHPAISLSAIQAGNGPGYFLEDFRNDFPDDETCLNWLTDYLYSSGIHCRKCQATTPHARVIKRRSLSCARCGHHVHPTVGTIYHNSRVSLHLWIEAIYLIAFSTGRMTAKRLEQELKVSYKTAGRMWTLIKNMLSRKTPCSSIDHF